jgi:3-dehydroquinate dehydratase-1
MPQTVLRTPEQELIVGQVPRVVGTLTSIPGDFQQFHEIPSDIVEIRFDEITQRHNWLERGKSIEAGGLPVLLTVRLRSEGGKWSDPDEGRLPIFQQALEHLAAVDVEFRCEIVRRVSDAAKSLNKACVVSYHDFKGTPSLTDLQSVVSKAQELGSIVKISTMINTEKDIEILESLLKGHWDVPLCVIGMGALGTHTRLSFTELGSCLTYGYLDKPAAPGQLSAADLVRKLRALSPVFNQDSIARKRVLDV